MLFASLANASVDCLSGVAARDAFVADKSEPYFSVLQPREMSAKTEAPLVAGSLQNQRDSVRSTYFAAVVDCSPEDIKGLQGYISIIESAVKPLYPGLVALPWMFIKVKNNIEGGLPHTRGGAIVFSESLLKSVSTSAKKQQWRLGYMNLLIHEQVHVIQRVKSKEFATLYEQQWGFQKVNSIKGAESWLAANQVINPDAIDVLWIWPVPDNPRIIWPRVIFAGEGAMPSMPGDFLMVGLELVKSADGYSVVMDKNNVPRFQNLVDEVEYMEKFDGISSLYHPNEIAADYLADLVLWDCLVDKSKTSPEHRKAMEGRIKSIRVWARKTFAS
jgi:hypothetical protein